MTFSWPFDLLSLVQKDLVGGGTSLTDASDVDGRSILERAGIFASAAADTARGINTRLLENFGLTVGVDDFRGLEIDRFGRSGAPLFADNAFGGHGPGEAAAAIVEGRADVNGLGIGGDADGPSLVAGGDLPDGAGGTSFGAEGATWFAIADARNEDGSPQPLEAGLAYAGCSALFGQTFMHSPQRMQRARKSDSSSAPGGRTRPAFFSAEKDGVTRRSGTTAAPAASPVSTRRRVRLGASRVGLMGKNLNSSPWCGQSWMQLRQRWHSDLCQGTPPMGSSPP